MKIKKAFTLVEVVISITIFALIILFLYKTLEQSQSNNNFFTTQFDIKKRENIFKKLFYKDLINVKEGSLNILEDTSFGTIFQFETLNGMHNPFYTHVVYFKSKNNLIRIESKTKFNYNNLVEDFFEQSYIDIVMSDVSDFFISTNKKHIMLRKNNYTIIMSLY